MFIFEARRLKNSKLNIIKTLAINARDLSRCVTSLVGELFWGVESEWITNCYAKNLDAN